MVKTPKRHIRGPAVKSWIWLLIRASLSVGTLGGSRRRLNYLGPCHLQGDLDGAQGSWLQPDPDPTVCGHLENQLAVESSLTLTLYLSNK